MDSIGYELSSMINEIRLLVVEDNISIELATAAESALTSLVKSSAIYGFNLVDKENRR